MRKTVIQIFVILLISVSTFYSQTLTDYILEQRGDTLVIKDYTDMQASNSLYNVLLLDTVNVPAGRVYMLKTNGYYPNANNITTTTKLPTVITGEDKTILVNNQNSNSAPPVICGATIEGAASNTGNISMSNNFTIENVSVVPAASDGTLGYAYFTTNAANINCIFENCYFEKTRWIFVAGFNANCNFKFKDCYFANMSGEPCRRNGGVYDGFSAEDTLLVENCTQVVAQGSMWKLRVNPFSAVIFNHNNFIN